MAFCRPDVWECCRIPNYRGAEPQNLMPVGDSLANGCLFSGKKLYSGEVFRFPPRIAARGKTRQR